MGTIEVTRFGMKEREMEAIADLIARIVIRREDPARVQADAVALRRAFPTLYYCFENGLPA
jgi:glycine hydroxymethyltransferase